jgi:hypothetical protein
LSAAAGQTRVLLLDDCPAGLDGFYAPAHNRIGLCRNNHSSEAALTSTLLHTIGRVGLLRRDGIEGCIQAVLHRSPLLLTRVVVQEGGITIDVVKQAGAGDRIAAQAAWKGHRLTRK